MSKRKNIRFILSVLIFSAFILPSSAQQYSWRDRLNWQIITKNSNYDNSQSKILSFNGAIYASRNQVLPIYHTNIPLDQDGLAEVKLVDEVYSAVDDPSLLPPAGALPAQISIRTTIYYASLKPYLHVEFIPIRVNPESRQVEKLVSFGLQINIRPSDKTQTATTQSLSKKTQSTPLASGDWFKVGVTETGIYRMDYQFLKSLGLKLGAGSATNIQVYGKAGGMLPQANSVARDKDLTENAIYVSDNNGNGQLDPGEYVLFYARGPHVWEYNSSQHRFVHDYNFYSDTAYYFVTIGGTTGKRIGSRPSSTASAGNIVTSYDDYAFHEMDQLTDITTYVKSGRDWFGEEFRSLSSNSVTKSFDFDFPRLDPSQPALITTAAVARSDKSSLFNVSVNGGSVQTLGFGPVSDYYLDSYVDNQEKTTSFKLNDTHASVQLEYDKAASDAIGWLDYIELNVRDKLQFMPGQFGFRDTKSISPGTINEYQVSNAIPQMQIWDVTDFHNVRRQEGNLNNGTFSFRTPADSLREYVAFDGNSFLIPKTYGRIANQDLHGLDNPDMVIIAHPDFMTAANRLADFHRSHDNFTVDVVTPQQIYNEFSSGSQDATAFRDFMKMFYDRAKQNGGKTPGYLLFFGDASYDYKNRVPNNTNYVPSYESFESVTPWGSYVSDSYFGFLDDNEGWTDDGSTGAGMMDISIGRLPVDNDQQAEDMVNKILRYHDTKTMGDWRNTLTFIADDPDVDDGAPRNTHFEQTEALVGKVTKQYPSYNIIKLYLDAFKQQSGSAGASYPDVNKAIDMQMAKGTLVMNYVGHGGEYGWAHERILTFDDINSWTNAYKMPLIITATCEFSRFDNPFLTSAGELTLLNPNGGAIALYTTTRVVEVSGNAILNSNIFVNNLLNRVNGKPQRLGDAFRVGQNASGFSGNTRSFTLLGDPAIRLALPENDITVDSVYADNANQGDTLKALSLITVKGVVKSGGQKMTSFSGTIYPTVYDKPITRTTLANEGVFQVPFKTQENIIYKGKASVKNGDYSFSFYVPKDIAFNKGYGKLSMYAENGSVDASGFDSSIVIGGSATNPIVDNQGPDLHLYMNDSNFVSGGLVDNNPMLIARVSDDIGINTIGSGVGHDLIGTLNNGKSIVLNDYYQADLDNYRAGTILYPFKDLADGDYSLKVKVWDVANNSTEATINFTVASSTKLVLDKILNYPNPLIDHTTFQFEHNRPNEPLQVNISIYNLAGQQVKVLAATVNTASNRVNDITWNGNDDGGNAVPAGIYIYRLVVKTTDGQVAQQSERLVVIR